MALCRRPETLADLRRPGLQVIAGDLRDPAFRAPLPRDATVFHLAAVRNHPTAPAGDMQEVNVRATLALARQAGEAGIARFVHVATALIYGPSRRGEERTEQDGLDDAFSAYVRSKVEAVRGIRELAREGLPAVTVCPTIVFGPDLPSHPNRVTAEIRRLLRGGPRIRIGGGRQPRDLVFVDDVVRGLLAAEARGTVGEEYLLGGEAVSPRELGRRVLALAGRRGGPVLPLPAGAAGAVAAIVDRLCGLQAGAGYATAVRTLLCEWRFSSGKARRDLKYLPMSLEEGLLRTLDELRSAEE